MSSENSSVSRIRQFGLYRGVEAKTQEYLRSPKRRWIRQGCFCAATTTVITVIIVVVMILIFEYFITVDLKSVPRKTSEFDNRETLNSSNDKPFADKLDSTDLGFDQASFEKMPLLVNAMQEKTHVDPEAEGNIESNRKLKTLFSAKDNLNYSFPNIQRTSPHPFSFEYNAPTTIPFFNSQNWLQTYRHAQRLNNLEKVIRYLETTMNAKFGNVYFNSLNSNKGFGGVNIEPVQSDIRGEDVRVTTFSPKLSQETLKIFKTLTDNTFQSDLLYGFKPDSPEDVNMLAESSFKLSPAHVTASDNVRKSSNRLMFKPIPDIRRGCLGSICSRYQDSVEKSVFKILNGVSDENKSDNMAITIPKSFSVMLDLYTVENKGFKNNVKEVYVSTVRPKLQFKRKSSFKTSQIMNYPLTQSKSSELLETLKNDNIIKFIPTNSVVHQNESDYMKLDGNSQTNIYPNGRSVIQNVTPKIDMSKSSNDMDKTTYSDNLYKRQRESTRTKPFISTTNLSIFEIAVPSTNLPEILKFSHEEAKKTETNEANDYVKIVTAPKHVKSIANEKVLPEDTEINSTVKPYVPLINGHYRSVNQNSKTINSWLNEKYDSQRTRNLEVIDLPCLRRRQYMEIQRRNRKKSDEGE